MFDAIDAKPKMNKVKLRYHLLQYTDRQQQTR